MNSPTDFTDRPQEGEGTIEGYQKEQPAKPVGVPSNPVYARVGDTILRAAQDGVRRNLPPQDIIKEIIAEYNVRLNVGELRLLLASRRIPE